MNAAPLPHAKDTMTPGVDVYKAHHFRLALACVCYSSDSCRQEGAEEARVPAHTQELPLVLLTPAVAPGETITLLACPSDATALTTPCRA